MITLKVTPEELLAIRLLANSSFINGVPVVKRERIETLAQALDRNGWPTSKVLELERNGKVKSLDALGGARPNEGFPVIRRR